jgi:hypothetical protein
LQLTARATSAILPGLIQAFAMLRSTPDPLDHGAPAPSKAAVSDTIQALEDGALHDLDADKGNLP